MYMNVRCCVLITPQFVGVQQGAKKKNQNQIKSGAKGQCFADLDCISAKMSCIDWVLMMIFEP
jgi:hypothetical protein